MTKIIGTYKAILLLQYCRIISMLLLKYCNIFLIKYYPLFLSPIHTFTHLYLPIKANFSYLANIFSPQLLLSPGFSQPLLISSLLNSPFSFLLLCYYGCTKPSFLGEEGQSAGFEHISRLPALKF